MEGFEGHPGTSMLAGVISKRIKREQDSPLVLDFGEIQGNGSLMTNTFPAPIPRGDYSVCRGLTFGKAGDILLETNESGAHEHQEGQHEGHETGDGEHSHSGGTHLHNIMIPEKMRSVKPGDRVLVAWVQSEAVVVDIIEKS